MANRLSIPARAALAAHDCLGAIACAAILSFAFAKPAFAYVDPSVITYTIQAVAGVAVALSAVAGVAFRRSRKALLRMLNVDENAHKEVEGSVHRLDADGRPILASEERIDTPDDPASQRGRKKKRRDASGQGQGLPANLKRARLRWPSRLWRSALASALFVGTLFIVAPFEMVAASEESLVFALVDVWQPLVVQAAVMALCLTLVMSLFWGRGFDFAFIVVVALSACLYLQAMVLNQTLPAADGSPFDLAQHQDMAIISSIVWIAVIAAFIALFAKRRFLGRSLAACVSVVLVVVQGAAVASIMAGMADETATPTETTSMSSTLNGDAVLTKEGLFELSPQNNVVVFVLDNFDVFDLNGLLYSEPDALAEMTGFTYFRNSTGSSVPTRYGVPFLLTGAWPKVGQTWDQYLDARYTSTAFTKDIVAQGYSLYAYTDTPGRGGMDYLPSVATNIHPIDETQIHTTTTLHLDGVVQMLYQMALYRDLPWVFKEPFWFYTDAVNQALYDVETYEEDINVSGRVGGTTPYVMDDAAYFKQLESKHLSVFDDGSKGSVHFIHLLGLHEPYTIDENAERHGTQLTTRYQQMKGTLRIVGEYLRQMKELGLYDSSYIIITSDHGIWRWEDTIEQSEWDEDMASGPIMLVKPSQAAEQSAQPCVISDARTGHLDYPATVISAVGGNTAQYGTTVFEATDPNRIRYFYWPTHNGTIDLTIYEYAIDGDVTNWYAWHRTGNEWPFNKPAASTL